jgi:hypothetical protein
LHATHPPTYPHASSHHKKEKHARARIHRTSEIGDAVTLLPP